MGYKEKIIALLNDKELSQEQKEKLEHIFPELQESEDEKIRKELIELLNDLWAERQGLMTDRKNYEKYIAWLEKQGESDILEDAVLDSNDDGLIADTLRNKKVKPKFKVGDWVVIDGETLHIKLVRKDGYLTDEEGFMPFQYEGRAHFWTIQDAKPGDVLASDKSIFIFQEEYIAEKPTAYCGLMNGLFIEGENACWTNEKCHPATKEQRDLLFQKMKEEGYEWDAEHKQLKKIEQKSADVRTTGYWHVEDAMKEVEEKAEAFTNAHQGENADEILAQMRGEKNSAWSEEDERNLKGIIDEIEANKNNAPDYDLATYDRFLSWLKSLKDRVQPKPKQEWSEEDIRNIENIDSVLFYDKDLPEDTCVRLRNWLKSLRPQNR